MLRGPIAILFISRDTFSDSIAKRFRVCFPGVSHEYRAIRCKMGYRTDMFVQKKAPSGGIAPCWGIAGMAEKVSRDRGYRSDTIAVARDMGPLSPVRKPPNGPSKNLLGTRQGSSKPAQGFVCSRCPQLPYTKSVSLHPVHGNPRTGLLRTC